MGSFESKTSETFKSDPAIKCPIQSRSRDQYCGRHERNTCVTHVTKHCLGLSECWGTAEEGPQGPAKYGCVHTKTCTRIHTSLQPNEETAKQCILINLPYFDWRFLKQGRRPFYSTPRYVYIYTYKYILKLSAFCSCRGMLVRACLCRAPSCACG